MTTLHIEEPKAHRELASIASMPLPSPAVPEKGLSEPLKEFAVANTSAIVADEAPGFDLRAVWVEHPIQTQTVPVFSPRSAKIAVAFKEWRSLISKTAFDIATRNVAPNAALAKLLTALGDLRNEPVEDEYGPVRPNDLLIHRAQRIVINAFFTLGSAVAQMPDSRVSPDTEAGIRISWRRGDKQLRVVFPNVIGQAPYIYRQQGQQYQSFGLAELERQLRWLLA